jgi:CheY-like chemotaxis protein
VRLQDDGIGIDPAKLPHIFELFVQAERRLDRSQGGIGLGLSLVKSLVEMHGGTVSASSGGLGKGSEFVVRLPVRTAPSRPETSIEPNGRPRSEALLPRGRILVVDDNVDSAGSMAKVLHRLWGQETAVAHDGPEALETAQRFRPDVILLDIGLPGMSGYEVADRLRETLSGPMPLIIAMTGLGHEDDLLRSRDCGFHHHLIKPVDLDLLRTLIVSPPRN